MKKSTYTIICLATLVILLTSGVKSINSNNGITGYTGGCSCHSGSKTGTVTITGIPATVLKGTAYTIGLTYSPGVTKANWGFELKASGGTLAVGTATSVKVKSSELTHSAAPAVSGTSYTFSNMKWTAPATASNVTFSFAAVGGNGNNSTSGDVMSFGTATTSVVLPVEFSTFKLDWATENKVNISWQTATEINTDHFEIENSLDGKNFSTISTINASGISKTTKTYTTTDFVINTNTIVYYRIKSVDKNGEFTYSNIQSISSKNTATYINNIYPNPVKIGQTINIEIVSNKQQTVSFIIVNSVGKIVSNKEKTIEQGFNNVSYKLSNYLVAGNYYMQVKVGNLVNKQYNISIVE